MSTVIQPALSSAPRPNAVPINRSYLITTVDTDCIQLGRFTSVFQFCVTILSLLIGIQLDNHSRSASADQSQRSLIILKLVTFRKLVYQVKYRLDAVMGRCACLALKREKHDGTTFAVTDTPTGHAT